MDYEAEIALLSDVPESFNLEQYIIDAGIDVVNNVAKFIPQDLNLFTSPMPVIDGNGLNFETGLVHYVERRNKTCMEIPTEKKNQAVDSKSMEYANAEYPVFYRENKRLFILPEPGESGDPFLLAYPMFRESKETYTTGEYLTDVLLTTATISTEASEESKIVSHNLFSGDYIVIKNTDADQQEMVTSGVNIIRLSPYVITIGIKWPGNAFSGSLTPITIVDSLSSNEEHFGNWFYDGSLNHKLRVPASTAHIVSLPNTKGVATEVKDLYFKRRTNTFSYQGNEEASEGESES